MLFVYMFGGYFILPLVLTVLFIAFLSVYFRDKKKSKLSPGSIEEKKLKKYKSLACVFGILAFASFALAVDASVLSFYAVLYM